MAFEPDDIHLRNLILFFYNQKISGRQAAAQICQVYHEAVSARTCERWYSKFKDGDFSLEDGPRSGRPSKLDDDHLLSIIEADPRVTTRELEEICQCDHSTIVRHLHKLGKVNKLGKWVPHELNQAQKDARVSICTSLLLKNDTEPFLKQIVTGDEKWVLYVNIQRKGQWLDPSQKPLPVPKPDLHPKKILLSIWWDYQGVIHFELLEQGKTINTKVYCEQLTRLEAAIKQKRPALANRKGIVFHQDNARPHTAKITRQKLKEFNWELMPHPAHSPDLAPSDYHLFRSLQNFLNGKKFNDRSEVETALREFFDCKPPSFYRKAIESLPERWEEVIDNNGEYILD